jgi:hypothetical protein
MVLHQNPYYCSSKLARTDTSHAKLSAAHDLENLGITSGQHTAVSRSLAVMSRAWQAAQCADATNSSQQHFTHAQQDGPGLQLGCNASRTPHHNSMKPYLATTLLGYWFQCTVDKVGLSGGLRIKLCIR